MNKKIPTSLVFLIVAVLSIFLIGIAWYLSNGIGVESNSTVNISKKISKEKNNIPKKGNVMCTQEVKACSDGSYVSRTGPNCEFAPCSDEDNVVGIANPASIFCEENGGSLEIRTGEDGGQVGFCKFTDGSECEEWAFMRGECKIKNNENENINTSDWQVYRNKEFEFEFKYPKGWLLRKEERYNNFINAITLRKINYEKNGSMSVDFMDNKDNLSLQEIFNKKHEECLEEEKKSIKELGYGGMGCPVAEIISEYKKLDMDLKVALRSGIKGSEGIYGIDSVYIQLPSKFMIISSGYKFVEDDEFHKELSNIFNQILSTFKFIN